jgi:hypothetical protein
VSGAAVDQDNVGVSQEIAEAAAPIITTFWNAIRGKVANRVSLDWVTCNHIGRDGRYTSMNSVRVDVESIPGTAAGAFLGADVSMAVSLLTAQERGYASKGRIFLPVNAATLITAAGALWGAWGTSDRASVSAATVTLINALNDLGFETGLDVSVCIFSPGTGKRQDPTKPGEYRPVTKVRIGALPDTQRRRQNRTPDLRATDVTEANISS